MPAARDKGAGPERAKSGACRSLKFDFDPARSVNQLLLSPTTLSSSYSSLLDQNHLLQHPVTLSLSFFLSRHQVPRSRWLCRLPSLCLRRRLRSQEPSRSHPRHPHRTGPGSSRSSSRSLNLSPSASRLSAGIGQRLLSSRASSPTSRAGPRKVRARSVAADEKESTSGTRSVLILC